MDDGAEAVRRVARVFDEIAEDYDQSGVSFFGPIAEGLVELLDPRPGEHLVDVGCGRGALTFPAARAVGPGGRVTRVDISPTMVDLTRQAASDAGLVQIETAVVTPDGLGLPEAAADVVASSLVLFFAPDPESTLATWMRLLRRAGGSASPPSGEPDPTWKRVEQLFAPHLPPALLDARTSGEAGPFSSDEGVEGLFARCGATDVRSVRRPLDVHFDDATAWRRFSMSTGQRAFSAVRARGAPRAAVPRGGRDPRGRAHRRRGHRGGPERALHPRSASGLSHGPAQRVAQRLLGIDPGGVRLGHQRQQPVAEVGLAVAGVGQVARDRRSPLQHLGRGQQRRQTGTDPVVGRRGAGSGPRAPCARPP